MAARRKPTGKKKRKAGKPQKPTPQKPTSKKATPRSAATKKPATKKPATKKPAAAKPAAKNVVKRASKRVVEIQEIIDLMLQVGAVELETDDGKGGRLRVRLKEDQPPTVISSAVVPQLAAPALAPVFAHPAARLQDAEAPPAPADVEAGEPFVSPMVGTFYRAASPDAEPFAQVGDTIGEDTTICIIEAMKVMNEIKAEMVGTIVEILVENGEPVEFGQPLFRVTRG